MSPVDELARQIRMEFDFLHEAETMDAVGEHLMVSTTAVHETLLPQHTERPFAIVIPIAFFYFLSLR